MINSSNSTSNRSERETNDPIDLPFTGERVIPGKVDPDLFNEHFARYVYAQQFCSGKYVLDTGCGVGYGSCFLAGTAAAVVGIDIDPHAIKYARTHFGLPNVSYLAADCQSLPFDNRIFDVITSFELIEHLPDAGKYLSEAKRVLKQDGVFVVSTPNQEIYGEHRAGEANPFHIREWKYDEFAALLKQWFAYVEFLGESHISAVGILPRGITGRVSAHLDQSGVPEKSDYFICVCSQKPVQPGRGLIFVPSSANVLLERERYIRALTEEVSARDAYLSRLQPEFDEKARWANDLNSELSRAQQDCGRLEVGKKELELENERLKTEQASLRATNQRLSLEIEMLAALWRKATRWKRMLASLALLPLDLTTVCTLIVCEWTGRVLRFIAPVKSPAFLPTKQECSFIIVSWNGKDLLAESLPPLVEEMKREGGNHEIIVVDNGSIDGTSDFVKQNFPDVVLVRSEQNLYFGGGNRLGMQRATRDLVVLLNNDMIVQPGFIGPLLQPFRDPTVFGVASQVFLPTGKPRQETGKTRAEFNGSDLDWRHDPVSITDELNKYTPVFWLHGGATAIDRRKYQWLGGLDVLYDPFYVEDADLSYRAWKVGWQCLLASHSHVLHKHRSSTQRFGDGFIRQIVRRNHYIFLWKNFGDIGLLVRHFVHASRLRARRAGVLGVGIEREIRAYIGAVKRLPSILLRKVQIARSAARTDQKIFSITSEPQPPRITSNEINFSHGDFDEYLGGHWYRVERDGDRPYRWMADKGCVFLSAPAEIAELVVEGYVPPLSNYARNPLVLAVSNIGQQQQLTMKEGTFSHTWPIHGLKRGEPVRIELALNQTIQNSQDERTLGIMFFRIALSATEGGKREMQNPTSIKSMSFVGSARPGRAMSAEGPKRLLFICAYLPCVGLHGGGNTMFHLIRTLSNRYRITVLSFFDRDSEQALAPLLVPYCERLEVLRRGQTFDASNPFGIKPASIVNEFYHKGMQRMVDEFLRSEQFDVIDCEYLQTGHFVMNHPEIPAVVSHHEVYSMSIQNRYKALPLSIERINGFIEWMRMLNYEERVFRRFSSVLLVTEKERDYLRRYMPWVSTYSHPTGVDTEFFAPSAETAERGSVAFLGNFQHAPNVGGLSWFVENVWFRVRARFSGAKLYVVGGSPPDSIQHFNGIDNIEVTGWVKDVRPYLQRSAVFIAPMREGVGLRGKILEAWAMRKPVVGTSLAFLGLDHPDGHAGFAADDEQMFADRICQVLENDELAHEMGTRARNLVLNSYSWEAFADFYDGAYRQAMRDKGRDSSVASSEPSMQLHLQQTSGVRK